MKKAVIFDLDGTLADTLESIKHCADQAIAACGYPPISERKYKVFVGDGTGMLIKRCLAYSGDETEASYEKALTLYQIHFKEGCTYHVKPYDGMVETLDALKKAGVKIAVFSNKAHENTVRVVETVFGKGYFDEILGQTDNRPRKPNPEGVFYLAEKMGISPKDIAYVGDTSTDMMTGKAAGAFTIGVLWGFRDRAELEKNHADAIVENPRELLHYV